MLQYFLENCKITPEKSFSFVEKINVNHVMSEYSTGMIKDVVEAIPDG